MGLCDRIRQHITALHPEHAVICPSVETAKAALAEIFRESNALLLILKAAVDPITYEGGQAFTAECAAYAELHVQLSDASMVVSGTWIASLCRSRNTASLLDVQAFNISEEASALLTHVAATVKTNASTILNDAWSSITSMMSAYFGEKFDPSTTSAVAGFDGKTPDDSNPLHQVPHCVLDNFDNDYDASVGGIFALADLHAENIEGIDMVAVFHDNGLSGNLAGGLLLLKDVMRALIGIGHSRFVMFEDFDWASVTDQTATKREVNTFIAGTKKALDNLEKVSTSSAALRQVIASGDRYTKLASESHQKADGAGELAASSTFVKSDQLSFKRLSDYADACSIWTRSGLEIVRAKYADLFKQCTESTASVWQSYDRFESTFPGPTFDCTAVKELTDANLAMSYIPQYLFMIHMVLDKARGDFAAHSLASERRHVLMSSRLLS